MENIISEELLSEVLGFKINNFRYIDYVPHPYVGINEIRSGGFKGSINIHELAHECKEKAKEYGFVIGSIDNESVVCDKHTKKVIKTFKADTENNSIFKAYQWASDNKKEK